MPTSDGARACNPHTLAGAYRVHLYGWRQLRQPPVQILSAAYLCVNLVLLLTIITNQLKGVKILYDLRELSSEWNGRTNVLVAD